MDDSYMKHVFHCSSIWCIILHFWNCRLTNLHLEPQPPGKVFAISIRFKRHLRVYVSQSLFWLLLLCPAICLFYPYKGKSVPQFFIQKLQIGGVFYCYFRHSGIGGGAALVANINRLYLKRNIHLNLATNSSTVKTDLLSGRAFLSLVSALFRLVCLC